MKKSEMLFAANYRYNLDRDLFVNRQAKKAFSLEFVDDKPVATVRKRIEEVTDGSGWRFYFNHPPSDGVRRLLEQDSGSRLNLMQARTPEDRLREQYFDMHSEMQRVVWQLEAEVRYYTLPILHSLGTGEQLVVDSRVKECESALEKLMRIKGLEGRRFDPDLADEYSLLDLPDLAGVRVLVFPNRRLDEVDKILRAQFQDWTSKPLKDRKGEILAPRYFGYCEDVSRRVCAEYQVVPMLLGLFWRVEHPAMYKFRRVADSREMRRRRGEVERVLAHFEQGIEPYILPRSGE